MRGILILCAVLLAGEVWAGENWQIISVYPEDSIPITNPPVMAVAGEQPDGNHGWIKTDKDGYVIPSPCHQRMQEAMKAMDNMQAITFGEWSKNKELREKVGAPGMKLWQDTMRDCVTGK